MANEKHSMSLSKKRTLVNTVSYITYSLRRTTSYNGISIPLSLLYLSACFKQSCSS